VERDEADASLQRAMQFQHEREMEATRIAPHRWPESCGYESVIDFIRGNGQFFEPVERPDEFSARPSRACIENSARLSVENDLIYVEGFAAPGGGVPDVSLPIRHAWCVDDSGRVIDVTWDPVGVAYFGIPFRRAYVEQALVESEHEADEEKQLLIEEGKTDEIAELEADQRLGLHTLLPVYELALGSRLLELPREEWLHETYLER